MMKTLILALLMVISAPAFAGECKSFLATDTAATAAVYQVMIFAGIADHYNLVDGSDFGDAAEGADRALQAVKNIASRKTTCFEASKEDAAALIHVVGVLCEKINQAGHSKDVSDFLVKRFGKKGALKLLDEGERFFHRVSGYADTLGVQELKTL